MATIKMCTDISQSKALAEILPIESADMHSEAVDIDGSMVFVVVCGLGDKTKSNYGSPVWSLAALLGIASTYCSRLETTLRADKNYNIFAVSGDFVFRSFVDFPNVFDNLVDACYEVIIKLYELKML